jgi:hypothetical protein
MILDFFVDYDFDACVTRYTFSLQEKLLEMKCIFIMAGKNGRDDFFVVTEFKLAPIRVD